MLAQYCLNPLLIVPSPPTLGPSRCCHGAGRWRCLQCGYAADPRYAGDGGESKNGAHKRPPTFLPVRRSRNDVLTETTLNPILVGSALPFAGALCGPSGGPGSGHSCGNVSRARDTTTTPRASLWKAASSQQDHCFLVCPQEKTRAVRRPPPRLPLFILCASERRRTVSLHPYVIAALAACQR